jgi:hypothetical protein
MRRRRPLRDGHDPIGPFHPYLVWAAILLFDLIALLLILSATTLIGDRIEDFFWPGGPEWID